MNKELLGAWAILSISRFYRRYTRKIENERFGKQIEKDVGTSFRFIFGGDA
jgi:hypothetical protein